MRRVRAYYEPWEPCFVVSHDGPAQEDVDATDQIQCHEATHQILHFHTWDLARKERGGKPLPWDQCGQRVPWHDEGFAEFFSSHRREGDRYVWMQPLPSRMKDLWIFPQVLEKRGWATWSLAELLQVQDYSDMDERAAGRITTKPWKKQTAGEREEVQRILPLMGNLFYARSWSLTYFCWYATDAQGRPKWRAGYTTWLRRTLRVNLVQDGRRGLVPLLPTDADFRKDLGLSDDARFAAFEAEWNAFEKDLVEKNKSRAWLSDLRGILDAFGVK
jgi:hypothetical protein